MGLKNYLAPLGTDVTAEYIPVTERKHRQASLGYYLDYLQAANSSNEQRIVWPGRVTQPYYGGSTLLASNEFGNNGSPFTVAKVERVNNQWSYSAGAGRPNWKTEYQNYVLLGLVSRYSSSFLSPSTVVNGLRIIQSEDYSVIPPLLTRYNSAMLTQTEALDLDRSAFEDCPNGLWLFWNSEEQYMLEAGAGILLATNHPTTPRMVLRYCYESEDLVWRRWWPDSAYETSMKLMFQKDGLYYYYADIAATMVPYADPSQSLRTIYIGLPYVYFPIPGASDINDFTATIKSLFLHLF
jgi:hypothetical protein